VPAAKPYRCAILREKVLIVMRGLIVMIAIVAGFTATPTIAQPVSDEAAIRATLGRWMADFNAGRADKVCDIFASVLRADVKGAGERDFDAQCKVLRDALADPARSLSYALDIKDIFNAGDMAAVRLVWTLTARVKETSAVTTVEEQGLDVFGRDSDGHWRIVRFVSYERP
jgi:ketosteroid isomerase-like protein